LCLRSEFPKEAEKGMKSRSAQGSKGKTKKRKGDLEAVKTEAKKARKSSERGRKGGKRRVPCEKYECEKKKITSDKGHDG